MLVEALGIDTPVRRGRRLHGRHAGAAVGGRLSRAAVRRRLHRRGAAPLGPEHRLPRGRPPGDHGRSRLAWRRLCARRACGRRRAWRWRAWPRTSPICPSRPCSGSSAASCSATAFPGASTPTSRWRAICATRAPASSTASTPTPTSTSPARWTISTSPPATAGVLADAFAAARDVRFCVFSFTSDWLYPTAESRPIVRALNAAGARVSFVEIESDKGHDAFLLDEPVLRAALGGFLDSAAQARGLTGHLLVSLTVREDFREILRLVGPGRGCSTSAAARAPCSNCWRARRASTAAAWRSARRASPPAWPGAWRWCRATPIATSTTFQRGRSTTRSCPRPCSRCAPARCSSSCCASPNGRSSRCPISAIGGCGWACSCTAGCR